MTKRSIVVLLALFCAPALAADHPGACADWTITRPGLVCTDVLPPPCVDGMGEHIGLCRQGGIGQEFIETNESTFVYFRVQWNGMPGCSTYRFIEGDGVNETTIFTLTEPCDASVDMGSVSMAFDAIQGRLWVRFTYNTPEPRDARLIRFDGFASLAEVLQSYQPATSSFSFAVPAMPEGLPAADRFDTYAGEIGNYDPAQTQPLQCDYPAVPPAVGDRLSFADTLPTPPPGTGRWYLTAVTHAGESRSGRRTTPLGLEGRDAGALPACDL